MPQYDRKMLILSALSSAAYVLLVTAEIVFGEVSEFDALFCVAFCIFAVMVNYVRWFFTAEIKLKELSPFMRRFLRFLPNEPKLNVLVINVLKWFCLCFLTGVIMAGVC